MEKRRKKPAVRPEIARQWLRRYEEEGESPPQIANAEHYDVRTVRKQLDLMRQEREAREARQAVLKQALERHYVDLCTFAEKLKADTSGNMPRTTSSNLKDDPMWSALREHLPRSPLWKDLGKWENLVIELETAIDRIRKRIKTEAESRSSMEFVTTGDTLGLVDGFIDGLVFHLQAVARGEVGLEGIAYKEMKTETGIRVQRGAYGLALVLEGKVKEVQNVFDTMMVESLNWEEYSDLKSYIEQFLRIKKEMHDELTKIMLRRIVQGRCIYCPF
jgi:hypothetical protein